MDEAERVVSGGWAAIIAFGMLIIGIFAAWVAVVAPEGHVTALAAFASAVSTIVGLLYLNAAGSD